MPRHADEEPAVMTPVCGPPILRIRHQRVKVFLHGRQIELLELFSVIERVAQRACLRAVLMKNAEVELIGPPILVRPASECRDRSSSAVHDRALAGAPT